MAEFKISRIRYTWRGEWTSSTSYNKDDVVQYSGSVYYCIRQHTASAFLTDQEFLANPNDTDFSPAWDKMADGLAFRHTWTTTTVYTVGDIVRYGGALYVCTVPHTSQGTFDANISDWSLYVYAPSFKGDWTSSTRYGIGDVVRYGGNVYVCVLGHTSSTISNGIEVGDNNDIQDSTLETWQLYYSGIDYKGDFVLDTQYKLNDLVTYNGSLLRCTVSHAATNYEEDNWQIELDGSEFETDWDSQLFYGIGSVVKYGGYLYYCVRANSNKSPFDSIYQPTEIYWELLSKGVNFRGLWSSTSTYKTGDVVRRGGNLYVAISDTTDDASTLDYLDDSNWEQIGFGQNWRSAWSAGVEYSVNDIVNFQGSVYASNVQHISNNDNFPGDNGSGFDYWNIVVEVQTQTGLSQRGDLLTYDLSRDEVGDTSSFGPTNVELGDADTVLTIDNEDSLVYRRYGEINRVVYVDPQGIDSSTDAQRGYSPFKPWKTIRFAAEQVDDDFEGFTTIRCSAGEHREIGPIIVPARTVIQGSELRSTTIKAQTPIAELANDGSYYTAALNRLLPFISDIIQGQELTVGKTSGNTVDPVFLSSEGTPVTGSNDSALATAALVNNLISYINFFVLSQGANPTLTGTNTAVTDSAYTNTVLILEANKEFFAHEAVAYVEETFPDYTFDSELYKTNIRRAIDAFKYDIIYTGNYKTILEGRYYSNAITGANFDDMFYLRDATGVRDCTLQGLDGILNPPEVFDLYQRPTGGAFCSLDPGWGPADDRTWILTRSPYIQGVTTIGDNCVGQKIDGALHNGGNKSMVSNDFTQVLSDGIGAQVLNNGRAELVSVFTYYCQIGYLAENGGIIRATNGNCSYGRFGAVADGVDPDETPRAARLFNRNQQATIAQTFAGDFVDEIQILEWEHAGQNYTQASAQFTGAGVNAEVVFEDFRDNAIFEARLEDTIEDLDSIGTEIGGGGYSVVQNNAQDGNTTQITIAQNDEAQEATYLGKRIILTSGPGTGQYGYITSYDQLTKVVTVSRESDDQPGWDHVRPGFPLSETLGNQTTYRIEPRVTFSHPGFTVTSETMPGSTDFTAIGYGETYLEFSGISLSAESGEDAATFNIIKNGRDYNLSLASPGTGYQVGETYTISGSVLGAQSPYNNISVKVLSTTDNGAIISFLSSGIGATGRFVVLPTGSDTGLTSANGTTWSTTTFPSGGTWSCLATGREETNGREVFVALKLGSPEAAYSYNGVNWTSSSLPSNGPWRSVVYGDGAFVAVSDDGNEGAVSRDGINWVATTLPDAFDSTVNQFIDIAYGKERFVALANSNNSVAVGTRSGSAITWETYIMDVIDDSTQKDWRSIAYGNDRFVAISSTGEIAYSFDGFIWRAETMPSQDGSTAHFWQKIRYAQGVFFAIGDTGGRVVGDDPSSGPSNYAVTSFDGVTWTNRELIDSENWIDVAFGRPSAPSGSNPNDLSSPVWITLADSSRKINLIRTGARALGRVSVLSGKIQEIKLWDPGSGYTTVPTVTFTDPSSSSDAEALCRTADGVLSQPSWINRGLGYRTLTTDVTISGDGFADIIPSGKFITVTDLSKLYGPGAQITFDGSDEIYTLVTLSEIASIEGGLTAEVRISPELKVRDQFVHNTQMSIRERYSQCRITGHDFLDIGTGNFTETNYPDLYVSGTVFLTAPENEVFERLGGRVFYASTDQDGNFRTGELFAVEQSTGIVTISADFFDLGGLTEIRLGGIRVGGTGAVIREFSTDTTFTEDSNNIVPTQRAIRRYLESRLTLGGSEIATASFVAGTVKVGPQEISNVADLSNLIPVRADFIGPEAGISGTMVAQTIFYKSF